MANYSNKSHYLKEHYYNKPSERELNLHYISALTLCPIKQHAQHMIYKTRPGMKDELQLEGKSFTMTNNTLSIMFGSIFQIYYLHAIEKLKKNEDITPDPIHRLSLIKQML